MIRSFFLNFRRNVLSFSGMLLIMTFGCNSSSQDSQDTPDDDPDENQEIEEGHYINPVFQPVFADPSVIKADDGYFYAYGTEDNWAKNDVHLTPIIRSRDLVTWEYVSDAFSEKPSWKDQGFLWAPDINQVNGKYYLYYSYSLWGDPDPGVGLAVSESPSGPFTDQGKLITSKEIGVENSIDPFYIDNDGDKYLFWGSFRGVYGIRLNDDGTAIAGEKFRIAGDFMEGSYIYPKDGYFYLFGSTGSCCDGAGSTYKVIVGRSDNLKGPYVSKQGDNFLNGFGGYFLMENVTGGFAGPGHNAEIITDDEGQDWFLYHAIKKAQPFLESGATKRPLMLDPIIWDNGWPKIRDNQPGIKAQPGPVFK